MKGLIVVLVVLLTGLALSIYPPAAAAKDQGAQKRRVVAFYGDSTIRGYQTHTGKQVAISLPDAFALAVGRGYRVLNEGADSSRVEHLLAGTDGRHPAWAQHIAEAKVDVVITNHASKNGNPVAQYKQDMRTMVQLSRGHGKRVVLMTPTPIAEGGLEAYVEAMRELAAEEGLPLIDVFGFLKNYMASTGQTIADMVPDGYHPADHVYVLAGNYAATEFLKLERNGKR